MSKGDDERLQRYFDGELAPAEHAEVEESLTADDRLTLGALGEIRGLVAGALQAEAAAIDLWPGIERQLRRGAAKKSRRRFGQWTRTLSWSAGLVAAAAALLLLVRPWHPGHAPNECDIESLETSGVTATVFKMSDMPHYGDSSTTVIWTQEED